MAIYQYRIINKGKGVLTITEENLQKVGSASTNTSTNTSTTDDTKLPLTGGNMTGDINFDENSITGLDKVETHEVEVGYGSGEGIWRIGTNILFGGGINFVKKIGGTSLNSYNLNLSGTPNNDRDLITLKYLVDLLNSKLINDLTTGGTTNLLSAAQGVVLNNKITAINTLLASDNINLDTVQEIVDAIETVQLSLTTILVNDLTTGGVTKALTAEMGKTLKGLIDALTGVLEENVILLQSNWTLVSGFWEYDYANALITATSIVDIVPYKESIDYVKFADIMPMAISGVGTVKIYATNQPIGDINVLIKIL